MTVSTWPTGDTTEESTTEVTINPDVGRLASEPPNASVPFGAPAEEFSTLHLPCRPLHPPGVRKPLRSSPLAGPALQANGSVVKVTEATNTRPSRISSTPDLAALSTIARPPLVRYARPKTADRLQSSSPLASQSMDRPSSHYSPLLRDLEQSRTAEVKRPISLLQQSLSNSASGRVHWPLPTTADLPEDGNISPSPPATRRPKTAHGYPSVPPPPPLSNQSSDGQSSAHTLTRELQSNSWFIASPYEVTPKFSRLSLAAPNVVLPVSAKEHKRVAHQNSKTNFRTSMVRMTRADGSLPNRTSVSQQGTPGLPTSTLASCSSPNSASGTSAPLQPQENQTPPAISVTMPEGNEPNLRHDLTSSPDKQQSSGPATISNRRSLARFSVLNFRSLKSSSPSTKLRPLSMGDKIRMDTNSPHGEVELGFTTSRSSSATSESTIELKTSNLTKLPSTPFNVTLSVKRFWKSIPRWQHNRSRQPS